MAFFSTGTLTFLFTDIEGSTHLWETQPEAMQRAHERHDAILRQAIETNDGVVFKMIGDAFCAAFRAAPNALNAALVAQIALHNEPWPTEAVIRVRMAVHTGWAELRETDYVSRDLNRMARLLSTGYGGQTLVSTVSHQLILDYLPENVTLRDLGLHHLKDLQRPEQVFQVVHPDLPDTFPSLKSQEKPAAPSNLPLEVTSFIGREKVIADVTDLFTKTRLLTLTGAGGSGKTRLARQVAADVLEDFPDGVWFVELAPLADPVLVLQTVAQVLGVKEQAGKTIAQTLTESCKTKRLLLLLDNCEHLLSACADLAAALLRGCPNVRLLATSREPLGIAGETTYRVPSLSLPTAKQAEAATVESLSQYEAVRLFIERAQSVKPTFAVTNANAPALAQICYRLDGIPLAIELAAAQVRLLSVEDINTRLDNRFKLLVGGDRAALPRQQTLQMALDWSHDLLQPPEKTLFARLSVFAGGCTMDAAEKVCGFTPLEAYEVLDVLTSLVDKSLVLADEPDGGNTTRYRMLETLRQYGTEKRGISGETGEVKTNYRNYFVELAEEAAPKLEGAEQAAWLNRLEIEHDNLRAVLDDCAIPSTNAEEEGLRLAGALMLFWDVRGYFSEGRGQAMRALERGQKLGQYAQRLLARLTAGVGILAYRQSDHAVAQLHYEECLFLFHSLSDIKGITESLNGLGRVAHSQGDYSTARKIYKECLVLFRKLGDKKGIAGSCSGLAYVAHSQGDYVAARSLHEESLALRRELKDKRGIAISLGNLGVVARSQGDYMGARSLHEESLAVRRELGDKNGIAVTLFNLGDIANKQVDYSSARSCYEESLVIFCELRRLKGIAYCLEGFACIRLVENDAQKAVVLLSAANVLRESLSAPLEPKEQSENDNNIAQARSSLGKSAFSATWKRGRAMSWEQAADYALQQDPV